MLNLDYHRLYCGQCLYQNDPTLSLYTNLLRKNVMVTTKQMKKKKEKIPSSIGGTKKLEDSIPEKKTIKKPEEPSRQDVTEEISKSTFVDILDNTGVTDEYLAKRLKGELNARDIVKIIVNEETGKPRKFTRPLWSIKQKARMDAHRLKGHYPADKIEYDITLEDRLRKLHEQRKIAKGDK